MNTTTTQTASTQFPHLPTSIAAALDDYDQKITNGQIEFAADGYAKTFPNQTRIDADLAAFVSAHIVA